MAQKGALIDIVRTKTNFVKSQTEELHGMLDDFINKVGTSVILNDLFTIVLCKILVTDIKSVLDCRLNL